MTDDGLEKAECSTTAQDDLTSGIFLSQPCAVLSKFASARARVYTVRAFILAAGIRALILVSAALIEQVTSDSVDGIIVGTDAMCIHMPALGHSR